MNFQTANEKLNTGRTKDRKKVANNTYLVRLEHDGVEYIGLQLHSTNIICWYADGRVILNTGGWETVTTKARINEYVEDVRVHQEKHVWYVAKQLEHGGFDWSKESRIEFQDGMDISKL